MIKKTLFLILIVLSLLFINNVESKSAEEKALDIIDRYRDIARYTFFTTDGHLERYPEGFCGGTPIDDCQWNEYIEAIILLSAITLIIAAITLVFGIIFWIFRCICFGGLKPSHGCMCPGPKYDPDIGEGYRTGRVWILKILVFVFVAGCVAVFITSLKGNSNTTTSINDLSDTVLNKTSTTLDQLNDIATDLNNTKYESFSDIQSVRQQLEGVIQDGQNIQSDGEDISKNAKDVNNIRTKIIVIGLVFCMVAAGLLAIAALFNLPKLARYCAILMVLLIPFMWIVFSVHYPINSVIADVCVSYNSTGFDQFSNFSNPIISQVFDSCKNESNTISVFVKVDDLVTEMIQNGTKVSCDKISNVCDKKYPKIIDPAVPPAGPASYTLNNIIDCPSQECNSPETLGFYMNSTIHDFQFQCINPDSDCGVTTACQGDLTDPAKLGVTWSTCNYKDVAGVSACGTSCLNTEVRGVASEISTLYNTFDDLQNLWSQKVQPLIKCSNLIPFVEDVQDIVCIEAVTSLDLMIAPTAIFAILLTGLGIMGILGSKRFNGKFVSSRRESA
ncbi:hypothetical protein DICPUDRAFT_46404 [Dictyostelium purpureum]|uniref:Uncharacterized protein n=1 Tax=Dictyostelium purpureum TaxID=5786 RepID=F0ZEP7_DICPU|nr:uncharacterized protein DICPUDRAFT_46404 [Dictyostelium purpureum]EGC37563.1 hypothetical protein DICPUDRAFT_46404 [Dictyostelium purpureum]|eukprot:XP_003285889.1 hypothetical protein DICPUDRAFT_46404 [Dictyostelium purpureum]